VSVEPPVTADEAATGVPATGEDRSPVPAWAVALVAVALCLPLVVAVVQMRSPTWRPVLDLAMTELRVRDVGGRHTPLIGLPGRIGETLQEQGSHPGPASFYALAPTYRLLGSSAWALQVGTLVIHAAAIGAALVLARRRGGAIAVATVALGIAVLVTGLGPGPLTEPWNPYLPLLWWVTLLLALWSVASDDLVGLPVAVVAGSFCAQTHVPYLLLSVGLGGAAAAWLVVRVRRAPPGSPLRTGALRWGLVAVGLGVLAWLPPTVDQVVRAPGNYATLIDHFTTPPADEEPIGARAAATEVLERLDLWHLGPHQVLEPGLLTTGSVDRAPSAGRGAVTLVTWLVAAAAALRLRHRGLVALHAVGAAALALGALSISRIFGLTWYYLMLWIWAITVLLVAAVAWTAVAWWTTHRTRPLPVQTAVLALGAVALVLTARTSVAALDAEQSDVELSRVLDVLVDPTVAALERGDGAATGRDGTYLVAWSDALHIGSQAYGLMSELEREGFDVGLLPAFHVPATRHRTVEPGEATAVVQLATGRFVEEWRERPGVVEVVSIDPRSDADVERLTRLRSQVIEQLRDAGLDDVVDQVDGNLFGAAVDPAVPDVTRRLMDEMLKIGMPTSVFLVPPT
jgi:hypothetical protein